MISRRGGLERMMLFSHWSYQPQSQTLSGLLKNKGQLCITLSLIYIICGDYSIFKIIFVFQGYWAALTCRLVGIFQICYNECPRKNGWGVWPASHYFWAFLQKCQLYNSSWIEWFGEIILSCKIILFVSRLREKTAQKKKDWGGGVGPTTGLNPYPMKTKIWDFPYPV